MGDPAAAETGSPLAAPDQAEGGGAGYESFTLSWRRGVGRWGGGHGDTTQLGNSQTWGGGGGL